MAETAMGKGRLEAFSDGVIAVIVTIMVLEIKPPTNASLGALLALKLPFLDYALSFLVVAIMWVNHHHLLAAVERAEAKVLWTNNNLLFWMSLIPFVTAYLGQNQAAPLAVAAYGAVLALSAIAFMLLRIAIAAQHKNDEGLWEHHKKFRLKDLFGASLYTVSVPLAFVSIYLSFIIFALIPLLYFLPERKLEEN